MVLSNEDGWIVSDVHLPSLDMYATGFHALNFNDACLPGCELSGKTLSAFKINGTVRLHLV